MGCCGDSEKTQARKEEALRAAPFFASIAGIESGDQLLSELAASAVMQRVALGRNLDQVPHGTFVLVVEGELMISEVRQRKLTPSARRVSSIMDNEVAMAHRKPGSLFRIASMSGGGKVSAMMGLSTIAASMRSLILLLSPAALSAALESGVRTRDTPRGANFVSILQEMLKSVREPPPKPCSAAPSPPPPPPSPTTHTPRPAPCRPSQDIASLIAQVPCFAPLDPRARYTLAQLFSYEIVSPGSTLFEEGGIGDRFCILLHGSLAVSAGGQKIANRKPCAFLGEIALLYDCERTASVIAGDEVCSVLTLRAEHFQRMLDKVPKLREQVEVEQRCRIIYTALVFARMLDKEVDTEESSKDLCAAVARCVTVRAFRADEVLQGAGLSGAFYWLYQGTLSCTLSRRGAGQPKASTASFKPGGYAGGISMLLGGGSTEEVVATSSGLLLEAKGEQFFELLGCLPRLACELSLRAYGRKVGLGSVLHFPRARATFTEYQTKEYAAESSQFWAAALDFHEAATSAQPPPADEACRKAQELVELYVKDGAERQINCSSTLQREVETSVEAAVAGVEELRPDVFEAARAEIFRLMSHDTLPRYVKAAEFDGLMESLGEKPPFAEGAARSAPTLEEAREAWKLQADTELKPPEGIDEAPAAPTAASPRGGERYRVADGGGEDGASGGAGGAEYAANYASN